MTRLSTARSRRVRRTTTLALAAGALTLLSSSTLPGALAAAGGSGEGTSSGSVDVVNTETVQAFLNPDGSVDSSRVYEQLVLSGEGETTLENPVSTDGLRNLDGFGGWSVEGGAQRVDVTVDGVERLRSVSDYDSDELPVSVSVEYRLDGERIDPEDVVGASGLLEVVYTVRNSTGREQEVTYTDGKGGTVTTTTEVAVPLVASFETTLPAGFTDVVSEGGQLAGDGRGGMLVKHTLTLFPPVGAEEAQVGWSAQVTDGIVPAAKITALPINPFDNPTLKKASDSYSSGAETGETLAAGATEIDTNLLKLRDGAGELLAGLIQLSDGADQLSAGLTDSAAPGSRKLADGAAELSTGLGKLDDGAGRLADGAGQLSGGLGQLGTGVGTLDGGAQKLAAGQKALVGGLKTLRSGIEKLPASVQGKLANNPDYATLLGSLQGIANGIGTLDDGPQAETLLGGLQKLRFGLDNPFATDAACAAKNTAQCGATDALDLISKQLAGAVATNATVQGIKSLPQCDATCDAQVDALSPLINAVSAASLNNLKSGVDGVSAGIKSNITNDGAGIDRLRGGLSTGVNPVTCQANPDDCGIREGALFLKEYGIPALIAGVTESIRAELLAGVGQATPGCDPKATLLCAADALADGGGELTAGVEKLVSGVTKLQDGGSLLADGSGELAAGATTASDGSQLLADGADELADGLGTAADGSGRLAEGLEQAAAGAPKLQDGAQRLSTEGMSKLVDAGTDTAQDYGLLAATIAAGAERADAEKMAYGAPEGAQGMTAYSLELVAATGEGERNLARGIGAGLVLAAALGALALRRRFLTV